jgi:1-acyl-sn-glycerol-3-phosphate acyltransferase
MICAASVSTSMTSRILNRGFRRYVRRFINKNFNAVRIAGRHHVEPLPPGPIVCFANHPGWWDPLTAVLITDQLFPGRRFFAPIDAEALTRYPILDRLGFYPLARSSVTGTKQFLLQSRELLKSPETTLWLTPTGKFTDVRRSDPFMEGLASLVDRDFSGTLLAMAIEYTFWNERFPELLVEFGAPIDCGELPAQRSERTRVFEDCLAKAQASLAERAMARDPAAFSTLAIGRAGIGGFYDAWRRATAWVRGQPFQARHTESGAADSSNASALPAAVSANDEPRQSGSHGTGNHLAVMQEDRP